MSSRLSQDSAQQSFEDELLSLTPSSAVMPMRTSRNYYHAINVQLNAMFDHFTALIIKDLVRARFHAAKNIADPSKICRLKINAKKCLITLQKANMGDKQSVIKVLETAYGQRGPLRHVYLDSITSEMVAPAAELIPGRPRSVPPVVGPKLKALWRLQLASKSLEAVLPPGPGGAFGKPLSKSREANLRWQHHTHLLSKTLPPIPKGHHGHLKNIVSGSSSVIVKEVPDWRPSTKREMEHRRMQKTTDAHNLSKRMLLRLFKTLLAKSPVLTRGANGTWIAQYEFDSPTKSLVLSRDASDFELIT